MAQQGPWSLGSRTISGTQSPYGANVKYNYIPPKGTPMNVKIGSMGAGKSPAPFMGFNALSGGGRVAPKIDPRYAVENPHFNPRHLPVPYKPYINPHAWKAPAAGLAGGAGIIGLMSEMEGTAKPTPIELHTEMLIADPYAVTAESGKTRLQHYVDMYGWKAVPEHIRFGGAINTQFGEQ